MADARDAAGAAEDVLSDLAEHTEAFKRNFLVRGFFQQRGFYDIDALAPRKYRQFAADASGAPRCGSGSTPRCSSRETAPETSG